MDNNLGFWRKLILSLTDTPKTDADISWLYRKLARPEIPVSALWDAEKGAQIASQWTTDPEFDSAGKHRKEAVINRGWGIGQTEKDMPYRTPTGAIMKQLLNLDYLVVPEKSEMGDIWGY